jgi:hypothetical protein
MQLTTLFTTLLAVGLAAPALAAPEPVGLSAATDANALAKRATNCGINEHDPSLCPAGAECNCAIQNPVCYSHGSCSKDLDMMN